MKQLLTMNFVLLIMELGTMLYFIPLLIYLIEYSFGMPAIGFLAGILVLAHYYIYKWYRQGGSLIFLGTNLIAGAIGTGLAWVSQSFHNLFFPAQYFFYLNSLYFSKLTDYSANPLFYYFVFLTCIGYVCIGKIVFNKVCSVSGLKIGNSQKNNKLDV